MSSIGVREAKTHFSRLLRRVAAGEEIVIERRGKPVAKLVPVAQPVKRQFDTDRGKFEVPEDFNAPLPDEIVRRFYS
jgi:prevent-host-death family protein